MSLFLLALAAALAQETPRFDGEIKTLELDAPGGVGGAPEGMAFIMPGGAPAELYAGDLGEGVTGIRVRATGPADAVACTQSLPMTGTVFVKARVRVPEVVPGAADWHGATIEVRARNNQGALVSPPGMMFTPVAVLRAPAEWADVQGKVVIPPGATKGEVCFRVVLSTGTLEVDRLMVIAPKTSAAAAAPVVIASGVPLPPLRTETTYTGVGVAGGVVSPAVASVASVPSAPVGVGEVQPPGLRIDAPTVGSGVACSPWLPAAKAITVFGELTVTTQNPLAPDWSGIAVEAYAQGAGGPLMAVSGAPYLSLRARTLAGTETFSETWKPPAGAQQVKVCARVSSAAGTARVDWRGGR